MGAGRADKLADPQHYTGAHRHRFDEDGRGVGIAGRTLEHEVSALELFSSRDACASNVYTIGNGR